MSDANMFLTMMRDAWAGIGGTPEEAEGKSFDESIIDRYRALEARLAETERELQSWQSLRPGWDIAEVDKALDDGDAAHNLWQSAEAAREHAEAEVLQLTKEIESVLRAMDATQGQKATEVAVRMLAEADRADDMMKDRDAAELRATSANAANLELQAQLVAAIAARDEALAEWAELKAGQK